MSHNQFKRFPFIDQVRGLAIVLMVFFHFFYDLDLFNFVDIDFKKNYFWWGLPRVIVFLFLLSVGMSLSLVHVPQINWPKFARRTGLITAYALIISISTYLLFPKRWIYFGTLHCIALCSLMALPFLNKPKLCLLTAFTLLLPSLTLSWSIPWIQLKHYSMDYIPPFPWFGVVCLGAFFTSAQWHALIIPSNPFLRFLEFLGRHPLKIYLLHQPILYGLTMLTYKLVH